MIPLKRKQNKENQAKPTSRSARIAEKKRGKVTTSALIVDKVTSNTKFNSIVSFHLLCTKGQRSLARYIWQIYYLACLIAICTLSKVNPGVVCFILNRKKHTKTKCVSQGLYWLLLFVWAESVRWGLGIEHIKVGGGGGWEISLVAHLQIFAQNTNDPDLAVMIW